MIDRVHGKQGSVPNASRPLDPPRDLIENAAIISKMGSSVLSKCMESDQKIVKNSQLTPTLSFDGKTRSFTKDKAKMPALAKARLSNPAFAHQQRAAHGSKAR